jgi:hypothetical protein
VGTAHLDHLGTPSFLAAYWAGDDLVGRYIHDAYRFFGQLQGPLEFEARKQYKIEVFQLIDQFQNPVS